MIYDLTRWYKYAAAEATKVRAWSIDADAIYVVRFLVKGWSSELPKIKEMQYLFGLGSALAKTINKYAVKGVTIAHIKGGPKILVLSSGWTSWLNDSLTWMETDDGTWIVDVVFRALGDQTVFQAETAYWQDHIEATFAKIGKGRPTAHIMGIVTVHCGPGSYKCRLFEPDEDPDPQQTAAAEAFWTSVPDMYTVGYNKEMEASGQPPTTTYSDDYYSWQAKDKWCYGVDGMQLAFGYHDTQLTPLFACSGGSGMITKENLGGGGSFTFPDLANPGQAINKVRSLSTSHKILLGVFVLAGFALGTRLRRMLV